MKSRKKSARKSKPKASRKKVEKVLAYDLGGTKVAVGVVDSRGKVLEEQRVPIVLNEGREAVFEQLAALGRALLKRYPEIKRAGIASTGPLDAKRGLLLNPNNLSGPDGNWGVVPLSRILQKKLRIPVTLENDAAAAMLAEAWIGRARKRANAMILTLGTGLGTAIISDGKLVQARRGLNPEAGHIIIRQGDDSAPCACGNLGCSDAFLSGRSFTRRARPRFANAELMAADIAELARNRDPRALAAFEEYAELMAIAINNYVTIYAPELIVLTGSFAAASDLFLPSTRHHLEKFLARRRAGIDLMPEIAISTLDNRAGLIGGAYVALHPHE